MPVEGDKPGIGKYKCCNCSNIITIHNNSEVLTKCKKCKHRLFSEYYSSLDLIWILIKIILCPNKVTKSELVKNHRSYIRKTLFITFKNALLSLLAGFMIYKVLVYYGVTFTQSRIIIFQIVGAFSLLCGSIFKKDIVETDTGESNYNSIQSGIVQTFFFVGTLLLFLSLLLIIYQYNEHYFK